MTVGVLALQGSFNEHIAVLRRLGFKGVEIRKPEQLQNVSSLIIPGGESTTMAKLAEFHNLALRAAEQVRLLFLFPALREFVKLGKPVWGTCAGLIFLADKAVGQKEGGQDLVGGLECTVHRNYFGSQIQSFEAELLVPELASKEGGPETFRGVFIRAPAILEVGPDVEVLADYPVPVNKVLYSSPGVEIQEENAAPEQKVIVAVRQNNLLGTAFHPELTADTRWHSYFLKMAKEVRESASNSIEAAGASSSQLMPRTNDLPIFQDVTLINALYIYEHLRLDSLCPRHFNPKKGWIDPLISNKDTIVSFKVSIKLYLQYATKMMSFRERASCKSTVCYNKIIVCPKECPERKPKKNKKQKGCFINCGAKCEAVCKFRKANCNGYGSLCYDPRFIGGDGTMFYFHGAKGGNFAVVSDDKFQINAHFIGTRPTGRTRDYTWVQALAVMFDTHTLVLSAKRISHWDDNVDALSVSWDGEIVDVPLDGEAEWKAANDGGREVVVERTDDTNYVKVTISGLVEIDIKVRPIGEEENKVHNYQLPGDDAFAHLEMQFKLKNLSELVEGVLGKTYRPGYVSPVKKGVKMPMMGGEDKYQTPSLHSPLCKVCRFQRPLEISAI
ncbi:hypothetical protein ACFE04_007663 [Oxalis oulophora]